MKTKLIVAAFVMLLFAQLVFAEITVTRFEIANGASYTSDNKPDLTIETSPAATEMQFSCNNANYTNFTPFVSPYSEFNILNPEQGCTAGDGQKTVYVIVKASDGGVSTPVSDIISFDQTAPTVNIISPQNGSTSSSRTVSFDVADSVSGIKLDTIKVDVNSNGPTSFSTSACTSIDNGYHCEYEETKFIKNGTDYRVKVTALNNANVSGNQAVVFHYVDSSPPLEVTGVLAAPGNQFVVISWNQNTAYDLNGYRVYMGTSSGFDTNSETRIGTVSKLKTFFTKRGLSNGATYYFKVTAVDKSGNEGPDSAEVSAAPSKNASGIEAPEISSMTHADGEWSTHNDPKFFWNALTNATKYKCSFRKSGEKDNFVDCSLPSESAPFDPSGTQEGTWVLRLKGCDNIGNCGPFGEFTAMIDVQNPRQVSDLSLSKNAAGKIVVEWSKTDDMPSTDNSEIKEYLVYRHTQSGFSAADDKKIGTTSPLSFTDPSAGLEAGTTYYYKVRAVDNAGNLGAPSTEKSIVFEGLACTNKFTFLLDDYVGKEFEVVIESEKEMKNPKIGLKLLYENEGIMEPTKVEEESSKITAVFSLPQSADGKTAEITITSQDPDGAECSAKKTTKIDLLKPVVYFIDITEGQKIQNGSALELNASDTESGVKEVKVFYRQGTGEFLLLGIPQRISINDYELMDGLSSIPVGVTELKIQAFDFAGNVGETTVSIEVTEKTGQTPPDRGLFGFILLGGIIIVFIAVVVMGLALFFRRNENKKLAQPQSQKQKNDSDRKE